MESKRVRKKYAVKGNKGERVHEELISTYQESVKTIFL
jgi:hypothetical protein